MKIYSAQLTGSTTVSNLTVTEVITMQSASLDLSNISGSVAIDVSGSTTPYFFLIKNQEKEYLKVNIEGVTVLGVFSTPPTVSAGGMYFDNSGSFFVGL